MRVKLFKKPTCEKCKVLYERLKAENVDFDEGVLEDSMPGIIEMAKKQGLDEIETPVVVCDGKVYIEVTYEKIMELINSQN